MAQQKYRQWVHSGILPPVACKDPGQGACLHSPLAHNVHFEPFRSKIKSFEEESLAKLGLRAFRLPGPPWSQTAVAGRGGSGGCPPGAVVHPPVRCASRCPPIIRTNQVWFFRYFHRKKRRVNQSAICRFIEEVEANIFNIPKGRGRRGILKVRPDCKARRDQHHNQAQVSSRGQRR